MTEWRKKPREKLCPHWRSVSGTRESSCWNESCRKHASGSYTTKHSDLNKCISHSYGRHEFSVLGNSNTYGDITTADGGLEAIKGFSSHVGTLARHFAMGITYNLLRIHRSVSKRPASFPLNSSHDREFKRNRSAATRDVISAEEWGYRRSTPLSDGARFLQPICCCAQKRWPRLFQRHVFCRMTWSWGR